MLLVANRKNLKQYAKELLGNEYTEQKEKELIEVCTKKTVDYYHSRGQHISFAIRDWLEDINKILCTFGVESGYPEYEDLQYCNTGDTYALTIMWYKGKLRIGDWGTIAEGNN